MKKILKSVAAVFAALVALTACKKEDVVEFKLPSDEKFVGLTADQVKTAKGTPDEDSEGILVYITDDEFVQYVGFMYDEDTKIVGGLMLQIQPEWNTTVVSEYLSTIYTFLSVDDAKYVYKSKNDKLLCVYDTTDNVVVILPVE